MWPESQLLSVENKSKKQHAVGGVRVCVCLTVSWVNWAWISDFQSSSYFCFVKSKKEFEKKKKNNLFLHSVHSKKNKTQESLFISWSPDHYQYYLLSFLGIIMDGNNDHSRDCIRVLDSRLIW